MQVKMVVNSDFADLFSLEHWWKILKILYSFMDIWRKFGKKVFSKNLEKYFRKFPKNVVKLHFRFDFRSSLSKR